MEIGEELLVFLTIIFFVIRLGLKDIRIEGIPWIFIILEGIDLISEIHDPGAVFFSVGLIVVTTWTFFIHVLDNRLGGDSNSRRYSRRY